jgi:hypothetical protein
MSNVRRLMLVLGCVGVLGIATFHGTAAQKQEQPATEAKEPGAREDKKDEEAYGVRPLTDDKGTKKLAAAQDYIKEESWAKAARILQSLLDAEQDSFVQLPHTAPADNQIPTWVSVKAEANRLLGTLPAKGLQEYEWLYGPVGATLLKEAREKNSDLLLAEAARRFLWTQAGGEAARLLASRHVAAGRLAAAASLFEELLRRQDQGAWSPETLYDATRAFRRAGDKDHAEQTWRRLRDKAEGGKLRIGDQARTVAELEAELDKAPPAPRTADGWPVYRGDAAHSGRGTGDKPFMEKRWAMPTIKEEATKNLVVEQAVKATVNRLQPVLPAFFPIAADGKLIYRSYGALVAADLKTGKVAWEGFPAGALEKLLDPRENKVQWVLQWADAYMKMAKPEMLYENSVVGTLSTDNARVYVVDDLFLPPYSPGIPWNGPMVMPNGRPQQLFGNLSEAASHNRLQAYDLHAGKLRWDISADDKPEEKDGQEAKPASGFRESYFLGPPLPLDGKLCVLIQRDQELRLVCLEPETGAVSWSQALATTQHKLRNYPRTAFVPSETREIQGVMAVLG